MPLPRLRRATLIAALAITSIAPGALAGGPEAITVWRSAPSGTTALLEDISAFEDRAYSAWVERGSGVEARFVARYNGGANSIEYTDLADRSGPRVDVCASPVNVTAVATYDGPTGDRALELLGGGLNRKIEEPGTDFRRADVACHQGGLIALAVNRKPGSKTRLILWLFKPDLTDAPDTGWDLGPSDAGVTPAIAAGGGYLHVTWRTGTSIKYKRYKVGAAPNYLLTPKPTVTIELTTGQDAPRIAVDGRRVVVAWQRKRSVVTRVSTDKGASFGKRHTALAGGSTASGKVAWLNSVDVLGSTIVVGGAVTTGITGAGRVVRSTNGGSSWSPVAGTTIAGAFLFGALGGTANAPRLHIALDRRSIDPDPATIELGWFDLP